jgi:hypothetical protein
VFEKHIPPEIDKKLGSIEKMTDSGTMIELGPDINFNTDSSKMSLHELAEAHMKIVRTEG